MYPILKFRDPQWADRTAVEIGAFADENRAELRAAHRELRFPRELYREMGRRGWIGPLTPEEHGGIGGGAAEYCLLAEEVGRHGTVSPQISVQGQRWLLEWGTAEQKDRYLRGIATGEIIFSECISEPTVGSSFKDVRATAMRSGGDWILNGHKSHINLGADCEVTIFYAMADEGLTSFLVDMDAHGIESAVTDAIGLRLIPTADVVFTNVRVPDSALLGAPGEGLKTFLSTFNLSRLGNSSELIGLSRRAMALAIDYARHRKVGGDLVTDFQGIQWTIADIHSALYGAALARDHAANLVDQGAQHAFETTLSKKLAIDASEFATNEAFALVGGYGLYHDQEFGALLHEMKVLRVAGGSLEILRNFIARRILGSDDLEGLG
jgi:alkylation response protein AidB-like acyl-CoA dehydrogenase